MPSKKASPQNRVNEAAARMGAALRAAALVQKPKPVSAKAEGRAPKPPKSEKKADIWDRFRREVDRLAKELAVPQLYKLEKVREKGGKRGDAWKDWERAYTKLLVAGGFTKAERICRGDDLGESDVDILVPEAPLLKVDCKYKVDGWSVRTLFDEVEGKYVAKGTDEFLVLPLKSGGLEGSVSVIRSEKLIELLASCCLRSTRAAHPMSCPVCPGALRATGSTLGLAHCQCTSCGLEIQTNASNVPQAAWHPGVVPPSAPKKGRKTA